MQICGPCTFVLTYAAAKKGKIKKKLKSRIAAHVQMWLKWLHVNYIPVRWVAQCWVRWLKPISLRCFAPKLWPRGWFSSFFMCNLFHVSAVSWISSYSKKKGEPRGGIEKRENILCSMKIIYDSAISPNECAERGKESVRVEKSWTSSRAGQAGSKWARSALTWE